MTETKNMGGEATARPDKPEEAKPVQMAREEDLWDKIGFHRPLGGFWFRLILELGIILIPILFVSFWLTILYPYPESLGYSTAFSGLFVLVFTAFDIGTANTLNRFVADSAIKNPAKMVQYIQYFIWYQAITGLVQITILSLWTVFFMPNTPQAYGIWIILLVVSKQYPGYLNVFKTALGSLQQFNKKSAVDFLQSEAFQRLTEIAFVLLGRWLGGLNPAVGELMGIAIGSVLGLYLDDVVAMVVSGYLLARHLKPWGIEFRDLFRCEFDRHLVKECLWFGLRTGIPGLLVANTQIIGLTLFLAFLPQYTTFVVLHGMATQLVAVTQRLVDQDFSPLFTEAYQNGKKKLCQYYHAHAMRFFAINTGFAMAIMLIVMTVLGDVFAALNLERYMLTLPFLVPAALARVSKTYFNYPEGIMIAAHKPTQWMILKVIEEGLRILFLWLTVVVFRVQDLGIYGIVYVLSLVDYPAYLVKAIIAYTFIDRHVFKMRLMTWQTFVAPSLSCGILFGVFTALKLLVLDPLMKWNFIVAIAIGIAGIAVLVFTFYFPLTVLLGGWDDNSISDFKRVVKMTGPSKILVNPIAKMIFKTVPIARLHNRFKYDESEAFAELKELVALRDENRENAAAKPLSKKGRLLSML
ncbi:MAG: hypothetical protein JW839_01630 [Candidatus Lokiarchaeota archaeon]|nr:hypothetical protein [Candidatus Lokiarchaeota archaeon]